MSLPEFNLLDEPWIRVILPDCTTREVSLIEALLQAHRFTDLNGELSAQDVAVLRLLLAILYTVISRVNENGEEEELENTGMAYRRWQQIWKQGRFPEEAIRNYLETYQDRFWLFHETRPFWQTPEASRGTLYSAAKLNGEISESGHKDRLFSGFTGDAKKRLSYGEAARWLLYVNGFDDTSAKPKQKGLPSPGAGWLGKLGLITAAGRTLFETLMLNLVLLKNGMELWEENVPAWELKQPRSVERAEIAQPNNQAELLTLQSRRILLQREDGWVTGYNLLGGDFFAKEDAFVEQMTVWGPTSAKGLKAGGSQPRRHNAARQMWREFPAIFSNAASTAGKVSRPGVVVWIEALKRRGILDQKRMVSFRIASVQYGDKDFFITDVFSDALTFHTALLSELGEQWMSQIEMELERCHQAAFEVGRLAERIGKAKGSAENHTARAAEEQLYYRLDEHFRQWLYSLDPEFDELMARQEEWQKTAKQIARQLGREIADQAGKAAFVGRTIAEKIRGKEVTRHYSAAEAYNWFTYGLQKIYH